MKIALLDKLTLGEIEGLEQLNTFGVVDSYDVTAPDQTLNRIKDATIVITNKVVISREIMQQAPNLKLICIAATGTNNVDLVAAKEIGIEVKNVVGYSTKSVAQHTFTMLLALLGQINYYDTYVKNGSYAESPVFTHLSKEYWELSGKTLGIIGLGNIGKEVAKVAEAFGMSVQYYSTSGKNNVAKYDQVSLEVLLTTSDVVSIHAPLNEATKNLIGEKELKQMKPTSILVNTGRGGIVDEKALINALNEKHLFGACLDVLEKEPIIKIHPLERLKDPSRIIITPHIAWASKEARVTLLQGIIQNINTFLDA